MNKKPVYVLIVCDEPKSQLFHAKRVYPDHLECKLVQSIKEKGELNETRICKCEELEEKNSGLLEQIAQLKDENGKLLEENQRLMKRSSKVFKSPFIR